ncbi:VTC domain-containing protein [candidate division KSB1 bacterium]|nr:VTC domain-containing protein [candidate division KSB1 bacterium]
MEEAAAGTQFISGLETNRVIGGAIFMKKVKDDKRYEIKYRIPNQKIPEIRSYLKEYADADPHVPNKEQVEYTVRSIYFDTRSLDFYWEKIDGLKVRKKLRIRGYNQDKGYAFLEIKRKYSNCVVKERAKLPSEEIEKIIGMLDTTDGEATNGSHNNRLVSGKFVYNMIKKNLSAKLLVVYEREPYVGKRDPGNRVTIDKNIRSRYNPDLNDLFDGDDLTFVANDFSILELKFNNFMPKWMRTMIVELSLKQVPFSKYCEGIDACRDELN